jgi:hypothetical protein
MSVRRAIATAGVLAACICAPAGAQAASCVPIGPDPVTSITNDPGVAVLPFAFQWDAPSDFFDASRLVNGRRVADFSALGAPGAWTTLVKEVGTEGPITLQGNGRGPGFNYWHGLCTLSVKNAISNPVYRIDKKRRVVITFDRRRAVTAEVTYNQIGRKNGHRLGPKTKTVTSADPHAVIKQATGLGFALVTLRVSADGYGVLYNQLHVQGRKPQSIPTSP